MDIKFVSKHSVPADMSFGELLTAPRGAMLLVFLGAVLCTSSAIQAATISFDRPLITASVDEFISLDILMDFTDEPTVGGAIDVFYNESILSFQSFDFDSTTPGLDPVFNRLPEVLSGELEGIGFGSFSGLSGPGIVGTLTFQVIGDGSAILNMAITDNNLAGGEFTSVSALGGGEKPKVLSVDFGSTEVRVVPVPAAIWLFGSGLFALVGVAGKYRMT